MIVEAIEKLLDLSAIRAVDIQGRAYVRKTDDVVRLRAPEEHQPASLAVGSLDAIVDYLTQDPDGHGFEKVFLHVVNRGRVDLLGPLQPANDNARFRFLVAMDTPPAFQYGRWYPVDEFIVGFQAAMMQTDQAAAIICHLANLASEAIKQNTDDGLSQTISIKTGITTKSEVKVKNPMELQPIFTFREAIQPTGEFILRLDEKGAACVPRAALFHADEGALELAAMGAVGDYLRQRLEEEAAPIPVVV